MSLFIEPTIEQVEAAREVEADFVEFHTGTYANARTVGEQESTAGG